MRASAWSLGRTPRRDAGLSPIGLRLLVGLASNHPPQWGTGMWSSKCASRVLGLVLVSSFATNLAADGKLTAPLGSCAAYGGLQGDGDTAGMVFIPAGTFTMGSDRHRPEERHTHIVRVEGFWIDRHEVTNAQFARFVAATGYVTSAERGGDPKVHPNPRSCLSLARSPSSCPRTSSAAAS